MLRFLLILLILPFFSFGQSPEIKRTWNWYFGDKAGIDFSSGSAVAVTNGNMHSLEGCSAISDTAGNLLFYTDSDTVWNKNHQVMPNGTGLMGHWSGWQNSVIVPKPESQNIYYIFTIDAFENFFANGLRYSEINMTLDGGLGDIAVKNVLLFAPNAEELAAVQHANCKDIWVVSHKKSTNDFYAYLVTSAGISAPVITTIGNCANAKYGSGLGIKFSPDGSMLATNNFFDYASDTAVRDTMELYLFDRTNASLSNKILLPDTAIFGYSFSPDSRKLYVCTSGEWPTWVYQYDLSVYSQSAIAASKTLIFQTGPSTYYLQMQITPNQKIFLVKYDKDSLSVIDSPNLLGASCNYIDNGFSLAGRKAIYSLPNFIESYLGECSPMTTQEHKLSDGIHLYPNPTTGTFTVQGTATEIQVYDLLGHLLLRSNKREIDMGNYPSGIYIIRTGEAVRKLILH